MKLDEAIDALKNLRTSCMIYPQEREALDVAIDALERLRPKAPPGMVPHVHESRGDGTDLCGHCGLSIHDAVHMRTSFPAPAR